MYGEKGMLSRMWDSVFSRDKTVDYRTKALLCFLPKWKGFVVNKTTENMKATDALVKLDNVVKCLSNVWIEEKGYHRKVQPINFDVPEVVCLTEVYLICTYFRASKITEFKYAKLNLLPP